jgi:hypothetical protein
LVSFWNIHFALDDLFFNKDELRRNIAFTFSGKYVGSIIQKIESTIRFVVTDEQAAYPQQGELLSRRSSTSNKLLTGGFSKV